ncbi:MAG: guanylate kinase [Erysipelotrichaceae bacterium]
MKKGLLIILSGPSGVGKGTIREVFVNEPSLNIAYSVSMTTRTKRANEKDGVDYLFVDRYTFEKAIQNDELLEYAEFVGNYYGTPKRYVDDLRNKGKNVLLEIEVEGAKQVKERVNDALTIFIVPPSLEELEKRIRGRRSEAEEIVQQRLSKATKEMKLVGQYKFVVCNEDPKLAAQIIALIIKRHME